FHELGKSRTSLRGEEQAACSLEQSIAIYHDPLIRLGAVNVVSPASVNLGFRFRRLRTRRYMNFVCLLYQHRLSLKSDANSVGRINRNMNIGGARQLRVGHHRIALGGLRSALL